jgi:hypothetical protein
MKLKGLQKKPDHRRLTDRIALIPVFSGSLLSDEKIPLASENHGSYNCKRRWLVQICVAPSQKKERIQICSQSIVRNHVVQSKRIDTVQ